MKNKPLTVITWKEGRHWISECLNNHVSSFGGSKKTAMKNLNEALELFFEGEDSRVDVPNIKEASISVRMFQHA